MDIFKDKKIFVTGGVGSIGREIVKELLNSHSPSVVRIFDSSEDGEFYFREELGERDDVRFLLGDVRDRERVKRAMEDIDIVFHTAALKHVFVCEYNPFEALMTNVYGAQSVIDAALAQNVEKVIFTSSDKAVNPSNTMGATKLLAEKLITTANYYRGPKRRTTFSSVRFGNVLGSSGSIIPLIKKQIDRGGPVTLTDDDMTRFVLTRSRALEFLFEAATLARGGEVFVPHMPVIRIPDLIDILLEEYAPKTEHNPNDVEIKNVGIKSGEKLYEELMTEEEASRCFKLGDIYILMPQIKELSHVTGAAYPDSIKIEDTPLTSRDLEPLSKEKLREVLVKARLLEV